MISKFKELIKGEAGSGILLMLAAMLAMVAASSSYSAEYEALLASNWTFGYGALSLTKNFSHWVNDALMVLFFLLVGQEIKQECAGGELSSLSKAALPLAGALGGVLLPAAIYASFNLGTPALHGWAIPSATDIAFSLGVLSLFGARAPAALKVFLMALAVIDDLAAILIIAFFYTETLHMLPLLLAFVCAGGLVALNKAGVLRVLPYALLGIGLWLAVLESGVHATVAGVVLGVLMPVSTGKKLTHALHSWVSYGILPIFAFANAGVSLSGINAQTVLHPVSLGIILGLFAGKQLGIFSAAWLAVRLGVASLPTSVRWGQLYAVAAMAGIGFTMSLFIGALAFEDAGSQTYVRLGVLAGSCLSALVGSALMIISVRRT